MTSWDDQPLEFITVKQGSEYDRFADGSSNEFYGERRKQIKAPSNKIQTGSFAKSVAKWHHNFS